MKLFEYEYKEYQNEKQSNKKEYNLMVIENQITYILGELNKYKETDEMYHKLDEEFKELIKKKKTFDGKI